MWDEYWNNHPSLGRWIVTSALRYSFHASLATHKYLSEYLTLEDATSNPSIETFQQTISTLRPLQFNPNSSLSDVLEDVFRIFSSDVTTKEKIVSVNGTDGKLAWYLLSVDDLVSARRFLQQNVNGVASTELSELSENRIILGRHSLSSRTLSEWDDFRDGGLPHVLKAYSMNSSRAMKKVSPGRTSTPRVLFCDWDHFRTGLSFVEFESEAERKLAEDIFFRNNEFQKHSRFTIVSSPCQGSGFRPSSTLKLFGDLSTMSQLVALFKARQFQVDPVCQPIQKLFSIFGSCDVQLIDQRTTVKNVKIAASPLASEIDLRNFGGDVDSLPEQFRWKSWALSGENLDEEVLARNQAMSAVAHCGVELSPFFIIRFNDMQHNQSSALENARCALFELQPFLSAAWGIALSYFEEHTSDQVAPKGALTLLQRCGLPPKMFHYWDPRVDAPLLSNWQSNPRTLVNFQAPSK